MEKHRKQNIYNLTLPILRLATKRFNISKFGVKTSWYDSNDCLW